MTDIVERLRLMLACDPGCEGRCMDCPTSVAIAAAEEIERLREQIYESIPKRIPGESFLVEVSPGVFKLKAVVEAEREAARLRKALGRALANAKRPAGGWLDGEHIMFLNRIEEICAAALAAKESGHE